VTEQERAQAVAAVGMHEHQTAAAEDKVAKAEDKVAKYREHLSAAEQDLERAKQEADEERAELDRVRAVAERVLEDGPVSIGGQEVKAIAGVAGVAIEGKGRN